MRVVGNGGAAAESHGSLERQFRGLDAHDVVIPCTALPWMECLQVGLASNTQDATHSLLLLEIQPISGTCKPPDIVIRFVAVPCKAAFIRAGNPSLTETFF